MEPSNKLSTPKRWCAAQLVADVSEFIVLHSGDVLMVGSPFGAPFAQAGDAIEITALGFATLRHSLMANACA